jgi:hypothetical protein
MAKLVTLGSLSIHKKSFYFNMGVAKNESKYLAINGKVGDRREQIVIFDNQLDAFMIELNRVYRTLRGNEPPLGVAAVSCGDCHDDQGIPLIGTGAPDEKCSTCGRQL